MRARFAPSPTGNLHLGTLRTALFNWLLARHNNGKLVLRIEDTDLNRSESQYESSIQEGLDWLGLTMDEGPNEGGDLGPYRQSERITAGLYKQYADTLIEKKLAYYCFDTAEELDQERAEAQKKGIPYVYSRKALTLSDDEVQAKLAAGEPYTVRFKMPDESMLKFDDLIRGQIEFDLSLISDFVIMKSDGSASYNFAVVIDDMTMNVSHVVRGEDHISNTPQIALFQALGATVPHFAHMPMILGPDKGKLSKRHGATNVIDYRDQGFLPEAMFNYLSLLGWSPPDEKEIMDRDEIVSLFSLDRVSKSGAVFDLRKLQWMNGQYIRKIDLNDYIGRVEPFISSENNTVLQSFASEKRQAILSSIRDNLNTLDQVNDYLKPYVMSETEFDTLQSEIQYNDDEKTVINLLKNVVSTISDTADSATFKDGIDTIFEETGFGMGKVFKPIRKAISALGSGPNLMDICAILGKERIEKRLERIKGL